MQTFSYTRPTDPEAALSAAHRSGATYLAGGTTLVDLMRLGVQRPSALVDLGHVPLAEIAPEGDGLRLGAMARNSDVAYHPLVRNRYPVLSEALLAGASPQLRNMATVGGNLLQRTRCSYFRDTGVPCNKREPGSGCPAWDGYNRSHAILGGGENCIAAHPSDMCVALVALDAVVHTQGEAGARSIAIADFHLLPGEHPESESALQPGELITAVVLPASPFAARSTYLKVRDRASFSFALASAAVALHVAGGRIAAARVALGGVGTKPWRSLGAERALVGERPHEAAYRAAARAAVDGARPRRHNAFKVELVQATLVRALTALEERA